MSKSLDSIKMVQNREKENVTLGQSNFIPIEKGLIIAPAIGNMFQCLSPVMYEMFKLLFYSLN